MINRRAASAFALIVVLVVLAAMQTSRSASVPAPRFVVAHYMPQMSPGAAVLARDAALERWRGPGQVLGELREEERRFVGDPLGAARHDIRQARAAGLDGFAVLLAPGLMRHQFASAVDAVFTAAAETSDFHVAPDIWLDDIGDTAAMDALAADLRTLMQRHDAGWRRVNGRRFVSVMLNPTAANTGATGASLDRLFARIGGREAVYAVLYDPVRLAAKAPLLLVAADAVTRWPTEPYRQVLNADADARAAAALLGKPVIAAAMPSFMQSRPNPGIVPNVREKLGMAAFVAQWRTAIRNRAPGMMVATWNDRTEDSGLQPEVRHDAAFALVNRYMADWYRRGRPPPIGQECLVLLHHPHLVGDEDRRAASAFRWMRRPPPTDYVMVVALLARPAQVAIAQGGRLLGRRTLAAGLSAWLAYVPAPGTDPEDYPADGGDVMVTRIDTLQAGPLQVEATRGPLRRRFQGDRALAAPGPVLDLTTVAQAFRIDARAGTGGGGASDRSGACQRPVVSSTGKGGGAPS